MPIFEYRCDQCGNGFEELVFSSTKVTCPKCQASRVTKQLSVPARSPSAAAAPASSCEAGLPSSSCCGGVCHQH